MLIDDFIALAGFSDSVAIFDALAPDRAVAVVRNAPLSLGALFLSLRRNRRAAVRIECDRHDLPGRSGGCERLADRKYGLDIRRLELFVYSGESRQGEHHRAKHREVKRSAPQQSHRSGSLVVDRPAE